MPCFFNPFGWMPGMWSMPWGMGGGMWLGFLLLAAFAYWIYSSTYRPWAYRGRRETPLEIARQRLARGEISVEEFEEIKKNLQ